MIIWKDIVLWNKSFFCNLRMWCECSESTHTRARYTFIRRIPPVSLPPPFSCVAVSKGEWLQDAAPSREFLLQAALRGSTNPARPRPSWVNQWCPWDTWTRGRAGRSSSRPDCSPSVSPQRPAKDTRVQFDKLLYCFEVYKHRCLYWCVEIVQLDTCHACQQPCAGNLWLVWTIF